MNNKEKYECSECDYTGTSEAEMEKHAKAHHPDSAAIWWKASERPEYKQTGVIEVMYAVLHKGKQVDVNLYGFEQTYLSKEEVEKFHASLVKAQLTLFPMAAQAGWTKAHKKVIARAIKKKLEG